MIVKGIVHVSLDLLDELHERTGGAVPVELQLLEQCFQVADLNPVVDCLEELLQFR